MITQQELQQLLHYDPDTGVFTWAVNRHGPKARKGAQAGYLDKNGYRRINLTTKVRKSYPAHHIAWFYVTGNWPRDQIDHINGQKDDNRFCNLREATNFENAQNIRLGKNNSSGYVGVSYWKRSGRWDAKIMVNRKSIYLGRYDTPEEAAEAYKQAKAKYHTFNPVLRDSV